MSCSCWNKYPDTASRTQAIATCISLRTKFDLTFADIFFTHFAFLFSNVSQLMQRKPEVLTLDISALSVFRLDACLCACP